jgi:asparagine synthase (glutamine-hydrolysing)
VGAFLSGGLDSSSVVAFAREKTPDIRCFTIRVSGSADPGFVDDLPYAQLAANHLGVSLDVVDVAAGDMARDVSWMVNQLDEPLADPAALNVFYISKAARVAGIKVLLSGAGGDDLFTGYRRHLAERWLSRTRIIPERGWRVAAALFGRMDQRRALWRRAAKLANSASQSADDRLIDYFRWIRPEMLESLMEPAVRLEVTRDDIAAPMRTWLNDLSGDIMPLDRLLSLEQRFFLPDHNLTYTDKMSMAAGVETRVPFLDLDLVAYAATFSAEDKMHRSQLKGILKSAMKPWLPNEIIYRPKAGFGGPVRRWVLNELRELINDTLSEDSLRKRGIFKPAAVSELILANSKGQVDASYTIFSLLCVELWCRQYRAAAAA